MVAAGALLVAGLTAGLPANGDEPPYDPDRPRSACHDFPDDVDDAQWLVVASPSPVAYPVAANRGLDLLGLTLYRVPEGLRLFLKAADVPEPALATATATPAEDRMNAYDTQLRYRVDFSYGGKAAYVETSVVNAALAPAAADTGTRGKVAGVTMFPAPTATADAQRDLVTFTVPDATFGGQLGKALADGEQITGIEASVRHVTGRQEDPPSDVVAAPEPADRVWPVGRDFCIGTPPVEFLDFAATPAQYGDPTQVSVVAADADTYAPLEGMAVSFSVGTATRTEITDEEGLVTVSLPALAPAGLRPVRVSFAGDAEHRVSTAQGNVEIGVEPTSLRLTVARSSETTRAVTARVTDDDASAVAGQLVTWYANGRRLGTVRTNSAGRSVLRNVARGTTVRAVFGPVAGRYLGSGATVRAS